MFNTSALLSSYNENYHYVPPLPPAPLAACSLAGLLFNQISQSNLAFVKRLLNKVLRDASCE